VLSVLQKIISLTSRQAGSDISKLARWLRCLYSLALTFDDRVSITCLEKATELAQKRHGVSFTLISPYRMTSLSPFKDPSSMTTVAMLDTPLPSIDPLKDIDDFDLADDVSKEVDRYPPTELEWLATTTFNRSVDYYVQDDDQKCKMWAEKSFMVAQWLPDDGELRDVLMQRHASLQLK
jgi:hypothetical protein